MHLPMEDRCSKKKRSKLRWSGECIICSANIGLEHSKIVCIEKRGYPYLFVPPTSQPRLVGGGGVRLMRTVSASLTLP